MRALALAIVTLAACGPRSGSRDDEIGDGGGATSGDECDACPFTPLVDAAKRASEQTPMDCGYIGEDFEAEAWTFAHDCAIAALQAQTAVVVVWQPAAIDSTTFTAIVGSTAESYAITMIEWDCYQGDVSATSRSCDSVMATPNCTVEPGSLCLDCVGAQQESVLCE